MICEHCKGQHRADDCWHLHPEKKPYGGYGEERSNAQKETTKKEVDACPKAHPAVAAVAHAEGGLLDSAASFYMAREEADAVDKSRGGKQ